MPASPPLPRSERERSSIPVRRQATEAEARVLASALRLRIIRLCHGEDLTNKQIAQRLGRDPASVLHHVRRLVKEDFLRALASRRGVRGAREVPYTSTGKSWTLQIGDAAEPLRGNQAMLQAFLGELAEAGGELIDAARLSLRLRPEDREDFNQRIGAVLDEFAAREPDPDGEWLSVFFAMHRDFRGTPR
ncbi:MAG: ArsR/SmtB family transcription factor [Sciscionella sp.]